VSLTKRVKTTKPCFPAEPKISVRTSVKGKPIVCTVRVCLRDIFTRPIPKHPRPSVREKASVEELRILYVFPGISLLSVLSGVSVLARC